MGGNFSIAESNILALEEKLSCIDPQLALKTTSNAPKKLSNKPKKWRKTPILGYYFVLASDLPSSTCSETDDGEVEDERSKLAPNIPDPASANTLNNSETAKEEPHAFQPEPEKDAWENSMNAEGKEGADRVPRDGEGSDQHEALDKKVDETFPPIPLKIDNPKVIILDDLLKKWRTAFTKMTLVGKSSMMDSGRNDAEMPKKDDATSDAELIWLI